MTAEMRSSAQKRPSGVSCEVVVIGNRPAGELRAGARILQVVRAVDAQLANAAQVQRASTDAKFRCRSGKKRLPSAAVAPVAGHILCRNGSIPTGASWFKANSADHAGAGGGGGMSLSSVGSNEIGSTSVFYPLLLAPAFCAHCRVPAHEPAPPRRRQAKADIIFMHANVYTGVPANTPFSSICGKRHCGPRRSHSGRRQDSRHSRS